MEGGEGEEKNEGELTCGDKRVRRVGKQKRCRGKTDIDQRSRGVGLKKERFLRR